MSWRGGQRTFCNGCHGLHVPDAVHGTKDAAHLSIIESPDGSDAAMDIRAEACK